MKFTVLFILNNNPKFWIFQLHYSKEGVFQKGQGGIFLFLRSTVIGPSLLSLKTETKIRF